MNRYDRVFQDASDPSVQGETVRFEFIDCHPTGECIFLVFFAIFIDRLNIASAVCGYRESLYDGHHAYPAPYMHWLLSDGRNTRVVVEISPHTVEPISAK